MKIRIFLDVKAMCFGGDIALFLRNIMFLVFRLQFEYIEAIHSSQTLVYTYRTTRNHAPEGHDLDAFLVSIKCLVAKYPVFFVTLFVVSQKSQDA